MTEPIKTTNKNKTKAVAKKTTTKKTTKAVTKKSAPKKPKEAPKYTSLNWSEEKQTKKIKISDEKFEAVLTLMIDGVTNISTIEKTALVDWKTAKKITQDPDVHAYISSLTEDKFKNYIARAAEGLIALAETSSSDQVRFQSFDRLLMLGGKVPVTKQKIDTTVASTSKLDSILDQLVQPSNNMQQGDDN